MRSAVQVSFALGQCYPFFTEITKQLERFMLAKTAFLTINQLPSTVRSQFLSATGTKVDKQFIKIACSSCNLRELCLPIGMDAGEFERIDGLVSKRPVVKRGAALFRAGDAFNALYAIRSGFLKTTVTTANGESQVTGFQMAGEIVGLDGIASEHHTCDAIALEDTEVCTMPFKRIEEISREIKSLQHHVHKIMSGQIVRDQGVMLLLGNMKADERLAAFLLNLQHRLQVRGFSSSDLILRMTREEIGNYLGLSLETVSRTFSKFAEDGLIAVNQRQIHIQDSKALGRVVSHEPYR